MNNMKTFLAIEGRLMDVESFLSKARTIVTIGRASEEAYNVVPLQDEEADVFQCQLSRADEGWKVQNGQWRTECPKGIRSRLQHACNLCLGRCVNVSPAHPKYSWRMPEKATLLNGVALTSEAKVLQDGDVITIGKTNIKVVVQ